MSCDPLVMDGQVIGTIHRVSEEEVRREPYGEPRWCFQCRARVAFEYVVYAPTDRFSYYGPRPAIECQPRRHTNGDVGFGRIREWEGG